ncbi:MAG: lysophospholipid acyltransferase family protein [Candidatus Omnitrophota bacterium]
MLGIALYNTGKFLSLRLPLKFLYGVAVFLADIHYSVSKKDRDCFRDNLRAVFPDKNREEINVIAKAAFRNFAKYLVDFFRFELLNKENILESVEIKNLEYLDEALKLNKGVIALTAHIGNWELGGAVLGTLGYNFYAVALPHREKKVDNFFNRQRSSKGVNVIAVGRSPIRIIRCLAQNYIVAILGDRDFTKTGQIINFFGKDIYFPKGPAFFSLKSGSPIILGLMIRKPNDKFKLIFEKAIIPNTSDVSPEAIGKLITEYSYLIAKYIRLYPEQWFMFRRFWERENIWEFVF